MCLKVKKLAGFASINYHCETGIDSLDSTEGSIRIDFKIH